MKNINKDWDEKAILIVTIIGCVGTVAYYLSKLV